MMPTVTSMNSYGEVAGAGLRSYSRNTELKLWNVPTCSQKKARQARQGLAARASGQSRTALLQNVYSHVTLTARPPFDTTAELFRLRSRAKRNCVIAIVG